MATQAKPRPTKTVRRDPKRSTTCDTPGCRRTPEFDAPTRGIAWGYLCDEHYEQYAGPRAHIDGRRLS